MVSRASALLIMLSCFTVFMFIDEHDQIKKSGSADKLCISDIDMRLTPPNDEGPDGVRFFLTSGDANLNKAFEGDHIARFYFWTDYIDQLPDARSTIHIKKLREGCYQLTYGTFYFRDYPSGEVTISKEQLLKSSYIKFIGKNGKEWILSTCKGSHGTCTS